jgi:GDP-L-fucose synthase
MKILITGGNGFIARNLVKGLQEYELTIITRSNFDLTNTSQTDLFFKDKYFDLVLHCAVKGGSRLQADGNEILDNNLSMYYNLLNNKSSFNKLIHFGSGAEIYSSDKPYGLSKKIIQESVLENNNFYNIRIFNVFGEDELETRFIKANINRYINKESIQIHQNKFMDFFYIDDLITLVKMYINEELTDKEINCSYKRKYTLYDIARFISKLSDYEVPIIIENKDFSGDDYIGIPPLSPSIELIGLKQGIEKIYNKLK